MKKNMKIILPYIFIGLSVYFWYKAYRWEITISDEWSANPELSNLSVQTEYLKALVKIIMSGGIVAALWATLSEKTK